MVKRNTLLLLACGSAITSAKRPPPLRKIFEPIPKNLSYPSGQERFFYIEA